MSKRRLFEFINAGLCILLIVLLFIPSLSNGFYSFSIFESYKEGFVLLLILSILFGIAGAVCNIIRKFRRVALFTAGFYMNQFFILNKANSGFSFVLCLILFISLCILVLNILPDVLGYTDEKPLPKMGNGNMMPMGGQPPMGQPSMGGMPMGGQPPMGQPPMGGMPMGGQPPMSQPPMGGMPMGGQSPMGQPPMGGMPMGGQPPMGGMPNNQNNQQPQNGGFNPADVYK